MAAAALIGLPTDRLIAARQTRSQAAAWRLRGGSARSERTRTSHPSSGLPTCVHLCAGQTNHANSNNYNKAVIVSPDNWRR